MDAIEELKFYKKVVDNQLEIFFDYKVEKMKKIDPCASYIINNLKEYTLRGGKRIRAALMCCGYSLFSDEDPDEIIKGSIAFELIQSYLLIHDDIIDKDTLRRGGPTIHKIYENDYIAKYGHKGSEHFGMSMAIIIGDIANHLANHAILKLDMPEERKIRAAIELNSIGHTTLIGEALDILSGTKETLTEAELMKIHKLKTSSYTFEKPLKVGAILAGADTKVQNILTEYAMPLGQAFQLQDDILGLFGNEEQLGKPVGSDIREDKKTLLIIKALENARKDEKDMIRNALGNPDITEGTIED
ncbi:MAG: polyprenyl synthetase family protein, partial [archaeon]|nr:polyprenyl synthetase family protein [archaeon]